MNAHRIETVISQDRMLTLTNLPSQSGGSVEVIILRFALPQSEKERYPLRGAEQIYYNPTEPIMQDD